MNYKRRKRKRGGVKGCCGLCALGTRQGGLRNKRLPSMQERRAEVAERAQRTAALSTAALSTAAFRS